MAMSEKNRRKNPATSYRFDAETLQLIEVLRAAMLDTITGRPRSATDVICAGVRLLARKHLKEGKEK